DPLLDRRHRLEAGPAVGARGAADMAARDAIGTPAVAVQLVAGAAGDPERGIGLEGSEHPLEEVGLEGDVGIELEHDVGPVAEPREPRLEGDDVPARATAGREWALLRLGSRG